MQVWGKKRVQKAGNLEGVKSATGRGGCSSCTLRKLLGPEEPAELAPVAC